MALVLALIAGFIWANRGGPRYSIETRIYLSLRNNAERAGLSSGHGVTPRSLVEALRSRKHPAAAAAARVVDFYVRARFAGETLSDGERREMADALGLARKSLR